MKRSRRGIKVKRWRLWTFKRLDEKRKAVRCVIIGTAYVTLRGIFRQLEKYLFKYRAEGGRQQQVWVCKQVKFRWKKSRHVSLWILGSHSLQMEVGNWEWHFKWQETVWARACIFHRVGFKCKRGLCKQSSWQSFVIEEGSLRLLRDPGKLPASLFISTNKGLSLVEGVSFHITVRAQGCGKGHLRLIAQHIRSIVRRSLQPSWGTGKLRREVKLSPVAGSAVWRGRSVTSTVNGQILPGGIVITNRIIQKLGERTGGPCWMGREGTVVSWWGVINGVEIF